MPQSNHQTKMLAEVAIICSATEDMTYSQLYDAARNKKQEVGELLGKQKFNEAQKRLVSLGYLLKVLEEQKRGRGATKVKNQKFRLNSEGGFVIDESYLQMAMALSQEPLEQFCDLVYKAYHKVKRTKETEEREKVICEKLGNKIFVFANIYQRTWYLLQGGYLDYLQEKYLKQSLILFESYVKIYTQILRCLNPEWAEKVHRSICGQMRYVNQNKVTLNS